MPPRKRRRTCEPRRAAAPSKPDASPPVPELPGNILAEIAARSGDAATIFRCAATCKLLRREILSPDFIRRVTAGGPDAAVPSRFLGVIDGEASSSFSVVHPMTEAAETLATRHMAPFLSRSGAAGLVEEYAPLSSRGGLVVLRRRVINRRRSDMSLDMSVRIRVQTLSSDAGGKWGPLTSAELGQCPWWCSTSWDRCIDAGIVVGSVVHWLLHAGASIALDVGEYILTYDVGAGTAGSVDIPEHRRVPNLRSYSQLGSSPDGKLSLLVADQLMVSPQDDDHGEVVLGSLGDQSRAVGWRLAVGGREFCFLLDMETKETRLDWAERKGIPCEVDLASRLSSMKAF
ncbi:hypothetical protein HU200_010955 [Digitaria exilis]|uniref:DUF7595 domain-containing protein n=1 Tax=Digitaria exilis TaxID=1010633 RepID=A0A835KPK0_9POAL|nr:hypothetical protein HU200_010955 [Digitaria exilis]